MLLDKIIETLSSTDGSLTDALLKTKVLLHQIGKKELVPWVNSELGGYSDENVPPYRIIGMEPRGYLTSVNWQAKDQALPIMHLKEEQREWLTTLRMTESIQVIEERVKRYRESGNGFIRSLPAEAPALFHDALAPGVNVFSAWCVINMGELENIVVEVRSRLLDFALELREAVGTDLNGAKLVEKAEAVDAGRLFHTAIYGSGNTVVLGSHSTQTVTIENAKGDIEALLKVLSSVGVGKGDLISLQKAIAEDESKGVTPFVSEGETGGWFRELLGRAGKGAIGVSVDLLSSTIVKALASYSGMPL